ncbi:hypothetical protein [Flammeovirga sp. SJP92]|uniref:hypothetical protein n=1 Tax=Flammeovirga sp. SJP92 TaxID=1775430 RepID=UPI00078894E0|nr:hypothetical protein [Flammeovirga sp. SJP92]KXX72541.1 hypothetical protein AVL50_00280 [Flammeovirga sp. SJP92]
MLDALITSKTRLKLLLKFFLNPSNTAYLRGLAIEFSESTNSIRIELNRLEKAKMLEASFEGNKKIFRVNKSHPLFNDLQAIVHKYVGLDIIIERILKKLGNIKEVYLVGHLAEGLNSNKIELLIKGNFDHIYLKSLIQKVESTVGKKVVYKEINDLSKSDIPLNALKIFSL